MSLQKVCVLFAVHVGYLPFGKSSDSSIITFLNKFSKELKVLPNATISTSVSMTRHRGSREMLSRETLD